MKTMISSNEIFTLYRVETYDSFNKQTGFYYELFQNPLAPVELFKSLSKAEHAMHIKTEFAKAFLQKTRQTRTCFIA